NRLSRAGAQDAVHLSRPQSICMFVKRPGTHGVADLLGSCRIDSAQVLDDVISASSDQYLLARTEKCFHPVPCIRDQTGSRTCCFEDACRWGETNISHRFAVDIEHHASGAVEGIVISGAHETDP